VTCVLSFTNGEVMLNAKGYWDKGEATQVATHRILSQHTA